MKFIVRLNEAQSPFYTVSKTPNDRKQILFSLNPKNKFAEIDTGQITYYALDNILLGLKAGYITVDDPEKFFEFVEKVRQKMFGKKTEKGGDKVKEEIKEEAKEETTIEYSFMGKGVNTVKSEIENIILSSTSKEEIIDILNKLKEIEETKETKRTSVISFIETKIKQVEDGYFDHLGE